VSICEVEWGFGVWSESVFEGGGGMTACEVEWEIGVVSESVFEVEWEIGVWSESNGRVVDLWSRGSDCWEGGVVSLSVVFSIC